LPIKNKFSIQDLFKNGFLKHRECKACHGYHVSKLLSGSYNRGTLKNAVTKSLEPYQTASKKDFLSNYILCPVLMISVYFEQPFLILIQNSLWQVQYQ
jgi:hypothetical protein